MGGGSGEYEKAPVHMVTLSSYSIGKYEVTVGQYKAFCNATGYSMPEMSPGWGWQDNHPMVNVTYYDAENYCNWLVKLYGGNWRLPTEAEWEFAAKGGNKSKGYIYAGGNDLEKLAWFSDSYGRLTKTQPVGGKKPNELGLYDMSGNVREWCSDWYSPYSVGPQSNPGGPSSGSYRLIRGGSWANAAQSCNIAIRYTEYPTMLNETDGFRVVYNK
jgi:formylglycine-generating enzyme required for sulfatase activity